MYEIEIKNILLIFTNQVPVEQTALLMRVLSSDADIRLVTKRIGDIREEDIGKEAGHPGFRNPENGQRADFCITDIPALCRVAADWQIPALLYLHDNNKDASMEQIPYAVMDFEGVDAAYLRDVAKRFFHIPWTILETERCVLREMTPEDLDDLYEVYADPEISRYTENLYEDRSRELSYIRDYIEHVYRFCGLGIWVIIEKQRKKLIGRAGLAFRDGYDTPEIGFVIGKAYQRQGYAYEVCAAILKYCEDLDMKKIRVIYQKENLASEHLCRKLGFEVTGAYTEDGKDMITGEVRLPAF